MHEDLETGGCAAYNKIIFMEKSGHRTLRSTRLSGPGSFNEDCSLARLQKACRSLGDKIKTGRFLEILVIVRQNFSLKDGLEEANASTPKTQVTEFVIVLSEWGVSTCCREIANRSARQALRKEAFDRGTGACCQVQNR